jgi:hypothetical protein
MSMRINIIQPILDYENKPLMTNKLDERGKSIFDSQNQPETIPETVRNYITTALNNAAQNETFTADQKNQIFQLSIKLYKGKEVDLTPTERNLIKERVEKHDSPLICGRISDILYPEDKVDEVETPEEDKALAKVAK